jgi:competence protein ComEA
LGARRGTRGTRRVDGTRGAFLIVAAVEIRRREGTGHRAKAEEKQKKADEAKAKKEADKKAKEDKKAAKAEAAKPAASAAKK